MHTWRERNSGRCGHLEVGGGIVVDVVVSVGIAGAADIVATVIVAIAPVVVDGRDWMQLFNRLMMLCWSGSGSGGVGIASSRS